MRFLEKEEWAKAEKAAEESAQGDHEKAAGLMQSVAFMRENDDPRLAAEVYSAVALARSRTGDADRAQNTYDLAITLAEDNCIYRAWVLSEKSAAYEAEGAYKSAQGVLMAARAELDKIEDPREEILGLIGALSSRISSLAEKVDAYPGNGYPAGIFDFESFMEEAGEGFDNLASGI